MKEGGFYNTHARPQRQAVELVTGQAEEQLVAQLNSPTASPLPSFTIVDYGSSQGRNSLGLFQRLLSTFRRMHPTMPVTLVHEDVAANDWTSLFTTSTPRALADAHTFVLASGASFFEQVMPPASVDFAFSGSAFHWIEHPLPSSGPLSPEDEEVASQHYVPSLLPESPMRERFRQHAHAGWVKLFKHRAVELKPGARFVIVLSSRNLSNQGYQSTMRTLNAALQKAVQQGLILRSEMARMKNGMWAMTVEESTSLMDGLGFTILRSETWQSADPYWAALEETKDRAAYATSVTNWLRSFSEVTLFAAVSPDRRAAAAAFAFAEFKAAVEANCIEDRHWVDYNNHLLILQRN